MFSEVGLNLKISIGLALVLILGAACGFLFAKGYGGIMPVIVTLILLAAVVLISFLIINDVNASIARVSQELSEATGDLNTISEEITTSGRRLAEGTTEQAASIQETSSTLEESASMIHQTVQNTKEADALAVKAKKAADKGTVEMKLMLESMEELKKSSTQISKIIKVIDEIAFQTNILSLNAAVEAARAGDAGKGFAVVAEEVRNLAQKSANAAKDTEGIIASNIELSEKCLSISELVNTSLTEIKGETDRVSSLLSEITTASQEQEIGITQINKAVSQMETVLQSNAMSAQNSAESAEQLTVFAKQMRVIIDSLNRLTSGSQGIKNNLKVVSDVISSAASSSASLYREKRKEPSPALQSAELKGAKIIKPEEIIPLDDF